MQWTATYEKTFCRLPGCKLYEKPPGPSDLEILNRRKHRKWCSAMLAISIIKGCANCPPPCEGSKP
eukprot:8058390-Karenia_brevis.AAC.1